jgi:prepilin signal peptidase PulO-like enzyme (type II secretory pathway)
LGKAYPLSELITGVIFAGSYYFWPYGFGALGWFQLLLWLVVVVLLVSAAFADYRWSILPDKLTIPLAVIACASQLFSIAYTQSFDAIPGVILGVVVGAGIFYVLNVVSKGAYIGGGDVKLGLFYGILLGSGLKSMLVIAIGSTLGTIALLPMLVRKQKTIHTQIPFGPYLIIATILVYIFGDRLVSLVTTTYLFP